jgi:hypothetical protein
VAKPSSDSHLQKQLKNQESPTILGSEKKQNTGGKRSKENK